MSQPITGAPPKPFGFNSWQEWAASLADFLEVQGGNVQELALTGLAASPTVMGSQQILGVSTPTALTVPKGATVAFIQVEGQNVRWLDDGGTPTASIGMLIYAGGDTLEYAGDFTKLKLIEVAPNATINIEYRR